MKEPVVIYTWKYETAKYYNIPTISWWRNAVGSALIDDVPLDSGEYPGEDNKR